jgi:hypothetical protein
MDGAPEALGMFAVLLTAPPEDPFPRDLRGRPAAVLGVAWSGDLSEGERVLAPLRTERPPALDLGRLDLRAAGGPGRRRLAEWLTGGAVTGPPGLG